MTFPGTDYGEPWRNDGADRFDADGSFVQVIESTTDPLLATIPHSTDTFADPAAKATADRIVACVNALAGLDPAKLAALLDSADEALAHILELEAAWRRGAISEHDGKGGTRSNRNFALRFKLESALAELRGAAS